MACFNVTDGKYWEMISQLCKGAFKEMFRFDIIFFCFDKIIVTLIARKMSSLRWKIETYKVCCSTPWSTWVLLCTYKIYLHFYSGRENKNTEYTYENFDLKFPKILFTQCIFKKKSAICKYVTFLSIKGAVSPLRLYHT